MTENRNQNDRPGRPAAGRRLVPYQKFIAVGIGVILAVVLVVALRALGPILKPFLIAVFFCILIYPIERLLVRVKVPRLVAYLLIFGVVITAGYFMGKLISYNVRAFSDELPAYEANDTVARRTARRVYPGYGYPQRAGHPRRIEPEGYGRPRPLFRRQV